jgi:tetratricopeptide (TPR) repeat protein
MWIGKLLVVLSVSLLASQSASAARPVALEKQARKACLSGDYVKGVSILAELFVDSGDATYLYNQGRCYEQNIRYVEAAERFREYLRKAPKLTDADKAEVDKHIADCDVAIAKSHPVEPTPPVPASQTLPVPQPTPQPPFPQATTTVQAAPTSASRPWQHTAKWVATGAAVAFLGLGIAEHANYYSKNSDYNNDPKCIAGGCQSLANSADTAQTVAIVGYGAAAVATGLAITFWLMDKPAPQPGQRAGLAFTCAPGLASVSCGGRF